MPLYHFTDESNVASIQKFGLLSWPELRKRRIPHRPNSNDLSRNLDKRKGLQDYVRLALSPDHPMAFKALSEKRISKVVWLEITDEVVDLPGVLFSDTNAAANHACVNNRRRTAFRSSDRQAEVLVPRRVDPKHISLCKPGSKYTPVGFWTRLLSWFCRFVWR